ncbi:hypothetical protein [Portibacter marinus]|uniref:hypothetical protein n=1 Tax=Portibacter marinus TaxID=2898660 RepID=UPI001F1B0C5F|nr:hypothetical protein [Portibacter marinus]
MSPVLRNIIAIITGWISGSVVNIGLIQLGHMVMPLEGVDPNDMEALAAAMPDADPLFFIFPFLAHAIGTVVGATVATLIAAGGKLKYALTIGFIFLLGGIWASTMLPAPVWFIVLDLSLAYLPMAWVGYRIGKAIQRKN